MSDDVTYRPGDLVHVLDYLGVVVRTIGHGVQVFVATGPGIDDFDADVYSPSDLRPHEHDFRHIIISRPPTPPYFETIAGYRCDCGKRSALRTPPADLLDPLANARAALRAYVRRPWTAWRR